jgi:hypothetical protein
MPCKINLLINPFDHADPQRKREIEYCYQVNKELGIFDAIYKVNPGDRATYNDFFHVIKDLGDAVNVIANLDIYFDDTAELFCQLAEREFWALTRWEAKTGRLHGDADPNRVKYSQDVWAFRGTANVNAVWMGLPFAMGVPGCDNVLARLFQAAGYIVRNPCYDVRTWHLHESESRTYPRRIGNPSVFLPVIGTTLDGRVETNPVKQEVRHTFRKVTK